MKKNWIIIVLFALGASLVFYLQYPQREVAAKELLRFNREEAVAELLKAEESLQSTKWAIKKSTPNDIDKTDLEKLLQEKVDEKEATARAMGVTDIEIYSALKQAREKWSNM